MRWNTWAHWQTFVGADCLHPRAGVQTMSAPDVHRTEAEKLWEAFLAEVKIWYGCEPKSFLGDVQKHKECFIRATASNRNQ